MDSCGKRLGIAMTVAVVLLGLNAMVVLSGAADRTYERLLGTRFGPAVAHTEANRRELERVAQAGECARSYPKQMPPDVLLLPVDTRTERAVSLRMC